MNTIDLARAASRIFATTRLLAPVLALAMATTGCAMDGEDGGEESDPSGEEIELDEGEEVSPDTDRDGGADAIDTSDAAEPEANEESGDRTGRLERMRDFVHPEEEVTGEIERTLPKPSPEEYQGAVGALRGFSLSASAGG